MTSPTTGTDDADRGQFPPGAPLCAGAMRLGTRVALVVLLAALGAATADEPSRARPAYREIRVPAAELETWLARGEWRAIGRAEFETLVRGATPDRGRPPSAWIARAVYTATFSGQMLDGGRFAWDVRRDPSSARALLPLDPLRLAVEHVGWASNGLLGSWWRDHAVWGAARDGSVHLLVDRPQGRAEGRWNLRGRRVGRNVEFSLHVAPAAVSELHLDLPEGFAVTASPGAVVAPADAADGPGRWRILLGSEFETRLIVGPASEATAPRPLLLAETDTLFLAGRDALRVQALIRLEVLRAAVQTVSLSLPADMHVYSVRYGGEIPVPWKSSADGRSQRLAIDLPDPLSGSSRSIRIDAVVPPVLDQPVILPRPVVENAVFQSGRVRLSIESPLELRDYQLDGFREREALSVNSDGETMAFDQLHRDGRVTVTLGEAPAELAVRAVNIVEFDPETWRLRAELEWRAGGGRAFRVQARVPAGWDVTHVRPVNGAAGLSHQQTTVVEDGSRLVVLEFHQAVTDAEPRRIQIYAERPSASVAELSELPVVRPLDVAELESVLSVQQTAESRAIEVRSESLEPLSLDAVPEFAGSSELWNSAARVEAADAPGSRRLLFQSHALAPRGRVLFAGGDPPVEAPRPAENPAALVESPLARPAADAPPARRTSPGPFATVGVRSQLAGAGGFDVHRATVLVQPHSEPARFRFHLPENCELLGVDVGDRGVTVRRGQDGFLLPQFPAGRVQTIEIQYLSPAVRRFLRRPQPVPLPTISATVLRFEWQFAVPPRWELLAAPQDLMLDGSPRPLSWTRRLFGPLGRPAESPVFNPLDSEAWRRAAGGDPPAASGRTDEQPTRQGFAPDGWTVWRATALDVPPTLTVVLWSPSDANVLGWITFLSCLAIGIQARTILLRGRQRIGMLAAAGWLVTALIAPSDLALAAGGALLGTLLAILVPPAWLRRERHAGRRTSPAATDTTQSAPRVASGTAGILAFVAASLLYWQTSSAQEPPVPNAEAGHAGVDVLDSAVLVPVGPDRQPLKGLSVVYVARPLLERLETLSSRQPRPPEYLIASAEYRGRVDEQRSVAIAAAFRVAVLVDRRPVRIELPIGGAFPASGGACTVNGAPHPLFPADEGRTLVLVWEPHPARSEAGGFLDVAVHLEAARSEPPPGDLVLNVPPAGSNRAVLDFGEPQASVDFAGAAGRTELSADGRTARADLGRTGVVVAAWSRGAAASVSSPLEPQARIYSLIGVQPARLDYQCRVVYTFDRGTVDQVAVRIPADAIVRQVTTAAGAGHSLAPLSSTESRLTVEFSRPQGGEFHFDVTMTLPLAGALDAIPLPPVVPVEIGPASRVVRVAGYEVGVTASSEFQLQTATSPASRATQIPTAAFLQAFARADEPPATLREPLEAWRLSEPLPLTVALKLRAPVRRVRLRQTGVVGRGELDWTLRAEVDVRDAPAWRHTLVIDPRMIVDSVSVRHDEAERLVRWSRADGRLELFLRDKSSGLQDVVVAGRVPIDDSGEAPLPLIQFEQSEAVDSRLQLYAGEGVTAELVASDGLAPDSTGADASLEDRGLSAVGRFRLLHPLSLTPRLRWRMRPPDAAGEVRGAAGTVLAPAGEGSWTARTWLRLPAAAAVQGELRVNVPSSGVDELRVESAADHRLEGPVDGVVHVVLSATDGRAGELDVLIAQPVRPANGTLWDLLSPTVDQWPAMQHWLILPASSPLRPEGDSARPRPLAELPEWLCEQAAIDRTSTDWTAYDSSSAAWRLVDRSEHAPTRVPTAALLESLIHVTTDGRRMGRTTLAAGSRPPQRAEFDWPAGMRLRAAVVDGSPAEARITAVDDAAELLSVSARDGQPMQFVTLVWEQTSTGTPGWIDALAQPLPTPRHPAVSTSRLVVTGAKTRGALMGGTLGQPAPPDQQRLATLDRELARLRSEQEPAQAAGPRQNGSADPAPLLVLHGPTPSSDAGSAWAAGTLPVGPQPHVLRLWTFDRRVPVGALVLLGAALAVWLSSHAARLEPGERLGRHPQATMVVVGIVCWLCLVPGMLGFLLSVATVLFAARRLIRREPEPAPPRPA